MENVLANASREKALANYKQDISAARKRYKTAISRIESRESCLSEQVDMTGAHEIVLSSRTRNCMTGSRIPLDPEVISKIDRKTLLRIPNFGNKCLIELAAWLKQHGYSLLW